MTGELRGCRENLNILRKMKVDYDSRDSEAPENGNLDKIVEELAMIRLQLSHFTTTLGFINTNRIRLIHMQHKNCLQTNNFIEYHKSML